MKLKLVTKEVEPTVENELELMVSQVGNMVLVETALNNIASFTLQDGKLVLVRYRGVCEDGVEIDKDDEDRIFEIDEYAAEVE